MIWLKLIGPYNYINGNELQHITTLIVILNLTLNVLTVMILALSIIFGIDIVGFNL